MEGPRTEERDGGGACGGAPVGARAKYLRMHDAPLVTMTRGELEETIERVVARVLGQGAALLVDKQGLAEQLDCSKEHIDHLRKRGLPTVLVGQSVRFEPAAVLAWLKGPGAESSPAA